MYLPSFLSFPPISHNTSVPTPQVIARLILCHTAASHQPSILHMTVHGCQCPSLHCPTSSVPLCVHKSFSASVCIFLLCK